MCIAFIMRRQSRASIAVCNGAMWFARRGGHPPGHRTIFRAADLEAFPCTASRAAISNVPRAASVPIIAPRTPLLQRSVPASLLRDGTSRRSRRCLHITLDESIGKDDEVREEHAVRAKSAKVIVNAKQRTHPCMPIACAANAPASQRRRPPARCTYGFAAGRMRRPTPASSHALSDPIAFRNALVCGDATAAVCEARASRRPVNGDVRTATRTRRSTAREVRCSMDVRRSHASRHPISDTAPDPVSCCGEMCSRDENRLLHDAEA